MSYCFNPDCPTPQNPSEVEICQSCGSPLRLKERYRILQKLGGGTDRQTFLAIDEDRPTDPRCIIEQFLPNAAPSPGIIDRFDELGQHPQIPALWASFNLDDFRYIVREYIEGTNLEQELELEGRFCEAQIRELLAQVLPVLQQVRDRGLVHRDIRPENLIHREDGSMVLVGFASAQPGKYKYPKQVQEISGSPEYAPPEQIRGHAVASSDLYSLGVVCIHLLTDLDPFSLFDARTDRWMWRSHLKSASGNNPVSRHLGRILDRLLAYSPKDRYRTADEVLQDLKASLSPVFPVPQPKKWQFAALGVTAMALGMSTLHSFHRPTIPRTALQAQSPAPTLVPQPRKLPQKPSYQRSSKVATQTLTSGWGSIWSVAVSPDSRTIVSGGADGTIQVHNLDRDCLKSMPCQPDRILLGHTGAVWELAVSPNGRFLASAGEDRTVKLWNLETGKLIDTLHGHTDDVYSVAFNANGRTLASAGKDGTVRLWTVGSIGQARLRRTLREHTQKVNAVTFGADGHTLASGGTDGTVMLWDSRTGGLKSTLHHNTPVWSLDISPDGRTLASGGKDGTIQLWNLSKGRRDRTITAHPKLVRSLAFSPSGRSLASSDLDGTIQLWKPDSGRAMAKLKPHSGMADLAFSRQGLLVSGSSDTKIELWSPCARHWQWKR
ncbi:serine/threonine protein kinase [Oscillatoriales cyanobacterium LEGE 11467]|uniref:Serine/threonine protein kinase n=1 Tax=Zarconia navalis LEGE 11467 TaxID=1828826 RepID=A0A928Z8E0_9CYAN|nr:serine/threonine-protein kinase [Zarconia navalis]MBE9040568.1 serine/threonine protein kinase [Zarconia navalis LEGE 11467]